MKFNTSKTIVFVSLTAGFVLIGGGFFAPVGAQTTADLQTQIDALLNQIRTLQEQLAVLQGDEGGEVVSQVSTTGISLFVRNLSIGDAGEEVRNLQKVLNSDSRTKLASSGPGSPGNETTFFGPLTQAAVIKFQDLYASEILHPLGLVRGTGFVGPSTRAKLNELVLSGAGVLVAQETPAPTSPALIPRTTPPTPPETTQEAAPTVVEDTVIGTGLFSFGLGSDELLIFFPSKYNGVSGTEVTLSGSGFTPTQNTLHFGTRTITNITTLRSGELTFTVPDLLPARYKISVSNANGTSNEISFTITKPDAIPPVVESLSPPSGEKGTVVTIHGSGFMPTGNTVYTSYTAFENLSSPDGKTISITILPPAVAGDVTDEDLEVDPEELPEVTIGDAAEPVRIYVENINGLSNGKTFLLENFIM